MDKRVEYFTWLLFATAMHLHSWRMVIVLLACGVDFYCHSIERFIIDSF
jgi:hypothetical protein